MTQRVATLSGGEQNRLMLAHIFAQPHNFLVLDEPTNDLDIETIDLLQEVIAEYDGTVLIVSHDRDFLDRTVTAVLAFEEGGQIIPHAGGYSDYLGRRTKPIQARAEKKKQKPKPQREKQPRTDRLSYKQSYLLSTLPDEIEALTAAITRAETRLADMDFFAQDPAGYQKLAESCATDKQRLGDAEQQWLELEILREAIEE
jgi:ATP-binding cassette subfamily F protein uup